MINKDFKINDILEIDFSNEISVKDLIYSLDNSIEFSLFEINESDDNDTSEKNILIKIKKNIRNKKEK